MSILPVAERELRAAARQSFTYALRVLGVLVLLIVLGVFGVSGSIGPEMGGRLFGALHCALFGAVWVLVPVLTADCISRERREGTLPLLFLTNLSPRDIVYAKGLAHSLRAFTLWLAVLPILAVPLVAGGVGWPEVVISALVNFSSICLATAAGLAASALARVWNRALAVAVCLAVLAFFAFTLSLPLIVIKVSGLNFGRFFWMASHGGFEAGITFAINPGDWWQQLLSAFRPGPWRLLQGYGAMALLSLLWLGAWVGFAGWRVRRVWREEPPSARVLWLHKTLFTPVVLRPVLNRWLRWQLQRNPIGWLEQRSWSGRLIVWSWFAVVICIYSSLFSNLSLYQRGFHQLQAFLGTLLAGSIAGSAAGSFRRERETGVMELLLISPIREWQIIAGRVRGLWLQFLPAIALLLGVWLYSASFLGSGQEFLSVAAYAILFATLPVIGLYFSLARSNFIVSFLWTLLFGLALPIVLSRLASLWFQLIPYGSNAAEWTRTIWYCGFQVGFAGLFAWRLQHHLRYRKFALQDRSG